jgi:hypothetical protein
MAMHALMEELLGAGGSSCLLWFVTLTMMHCCKEIKILAGRLMLPRPLPAGKDTIKFRASQSVRETMKYPNYMTFGFFFG